MVSTNHDDILRLLDNEYGNLEDFSFRFSFANADNLPEEPTESNVTVQTIIRPMPYLENLHIPRGISLLWQEYIIRSEVG